MLFGVDNSQISALNSLYYDCSKSSKIFQFKTLFLSGWSKRHNPKSDTSTYSDVWKYPLLRDFLTRFKLKKKKNIPCTTVRSYTTFITSTRHDYIKLVRLKMLQRLRNLSTQVSIH